MQNMAVAADNIQVKIQNSRSPLEYAMVTYLGHGEKQIPLIRLGKIWVDCVLHQGGF